MTSVKWLTDIEVIDIAVRGRSSRPSATSTSGSGTAPPSESRFASSRSARSSPSRPLTTTSPSATWSSAAWHGPARRRSPRVDVSDRRRAVAAGAPGRRAPPPQLAVVGAAHPARRAGSDHACAPGRPTSPAAPNPTIRMEPPRLRRQRHPGHHDPPLSGRSGQRLRPQSTLNWTYFARPTASPTLAVCVRFGLRPWPGRTPYPPRARRASAAIRGV